MMSLTFGLFTQVSGSGPLGPLVIGMKLFLILNVTVFRLPYFFDHKTEFFSFQNSPKNLDPSYKTDLDLWDYLGSVKLVLQQNFNGLIWLFIFILERGDPVL